MNPATAGFFLPWNNVIGLAATDKPAGIIDA